MKGEMLPRKEVGFSLLRNIALGHKSALGPMWRGTDWGAQCWAPLGLEQTSLFSKSLRGVIKNIW